ncbi:MAG: hypothetical protein KJ050_07170 [Candidatus Omnitrophica bacterium]|nr:hypothetical protein [bacterium]MBW7937434.1 hypothetical protein [Candidatus Omnitrophota bacterium]MCE7906992.1 hypothetical protein [Candidatus Omnitrophica bacterium COP1]MBV6482764.1 hypothetical protein [bacterium]MCC6734423.1 hypothetical protein [Candidatus Omnitrophota bacterium]
MTLNELDALRDENQTLRLRVAALENQLESIRIQRVAQDFLETHGLVDEPYFIRRLHESVLSAERYARFVTLVMVVLPGEKGENEGNNSSLESAARLRAELRQTDLVGYSNSGRIFILLEESDPQQAVQALRRVTREIMDYPHPHYALANYPNDSSRDDTLLEIVSARTSDLRARISNQTDPVVHTGEAVLSLFN